MDGLAWTEDVLAEMALGWGGRGAHPWPESSMEMSQVPFGIPRCRTLTPSTALRMMLSP